MIRITHFLLLWPVLSALMLILGQGASAQQPPARPIVMICGLEEDGTTGWIPEGLIITRQENGRIEVFDPILQQYVGHPIEAKVTADSRTERTYGWALGKVRNRSGQKTERLDFRLTVLKADATVVMTVQAQDFDNLITGYGFCSQPR